TPMPRPKAAPPPFRSFLSRLAHFIGWSVMSNLAYNGYNHLPPLLLGLLAGPVPVAVYQAARNLVQPLSTLASAVDNFDKPRAARALANSGVPGMAGALGRTTLALILGSAPYLVLLLAMGGPVTRLVYGDRFPTATAAMPWFAAMQVTMIAAYPLETALFIVRRPDLLFWGRVVAAAAAIALCVTLIPGHGLDGAMAGLVGGMAVSAVAAAFNLLRDRSWIR
ncbi:MAG: hypothetical protein HY985_18575, partial [Magnetospirillum sp.]|nr:hypothetical protein [Magnetospirillum sp.]